MDTIYIIINQYYPCYHELYTANKTTPKSKKPCKRSYIAAFGSRSDRTLVLEYLPTYANHGAGIFTNIYSNNHPVLELTYQHHDGHGSRIWVLQNHVNTLLGGELPTARFCGL